jgi:Na+-driven multidrug efflux pump
MGRSRRFLVLAAILISLAVIAAASWHSVQEIHYLKSFYPREFSVREAFYASGVELIKVILIALPLMIVIAAGLYWLKGAGRNGGTGSGDDER